MSIIQAILVEKKNENYSDTIHFIAMGRWESSYLSQEHLSESQRISSTEVGTRFSTTSHFNALATSPSTTVSSYLPLFISIDMDVDLFFCWYLSICMLRIIASMIVPMFTLHYICSYLGVFVSISQSIPN